MILPNNRNATRARRAPHPASGCLAAAVFVLIAGGFNGHAQQPENEAPGTQVLTRGPVHEAFAGIVTFNPEPGVVIAKAPPAIIEELPPEERPEGENVTWIPGYWGWDDERTDFLWVSGTWRALPPGRQWRAGYWGQTSQGYQWTSGYWADATVQEAAYLPPPPTSVEVGPNIQAPSMDYGWTPGCWMWYSGRYAWRPGYWAQGRADWVWLPAHYVWTPHGYIFVGGYWDYPVERRGVLFAPVYFDSVVYSRRGYSYSPRIVIDVGVFSDHLFLRPSYSHYYFGDYYAPSYVQGGFYASFSFQTSRRGYDPFYSHQRWEHRQDREWEHRAEVSYQYRRDHEVARPPRTWVAQRAINPDAAESRQNRVLVATSMDQLAKRKENPVRFQPVAMQDRQILAQRGKEVQASRDQRRVVEAKPVDTTAPKPGTVIEPVKLQLPRSPIVAKPVRELGKNQAPPPAQRAPKTDPKLQPQGEAPVQQPAAARSNPQPQPAQPGPERKAQQASEQPAKHPAVKAPDDSQRNTRALESKPQPQQAPSERYRPAPPEKGAAQLMKRNNRRVEAPRAPSERPADSR